MGVYSIPSMSAEPERVFSGAKHTISHEIASLKPDTIEALECCKSMLRIEAFADVKINAAMAMELEEILAELKEISGEIHGQVENGTEKWTLKGIQASLS